jgi:hypothetical protein
MPDVRSYSKSRRSADVTDGPLSDSCTAASCVLPVPENFGLRSRNVSFVYLQVRTQLPAWIVRVIIGGFHVPSSTASSGQ